MEQVLILDCETNGLDPAKDQVIEIAAVRYSLEHYCVIESFASLICTEQGNAAEAINHIPSGALRAAPNAGAWGPVREMSAKCDAILAHNADFDRSFTPGQYLNSIPWIDTCNGVVWPLQTRESGNLISLALEHGLGVVDPHRALSDCLLLARLLTRCHELGHDVQAILARGLRPSAMFQALVSFDDKDKAKEAGFKWEAATKRWLRKMAIEDASALSFRTRQVEA